MQEQLTTVSATFTAEPIEETLRFWARGLGMPLTVKFAPYNQVFQQLLDPGSLVRANRSGINIVLIRFEDWDRFGRRDPALGSRARIDLEKIGRNASDLAIAAKSASESSPVPYLVAFCPPSPGDSDLVLSLERMEELIASQLEATPGVHVIRTRDWGYENRVADCYDAGADALGHVPYTPLGFAAIGSLIARKIFAIQNIPRKVVVLDCDQTLWRGLVGEDGVFGIEINSDRRALQEFISEKHGEGMLVCLCSKNNEEDVLKVFQERLDMNLSLSQITAYRINWRTKSENLRSLADELRLGVDSFIFIDDDPVVCAEVRASCPEVLTLQLPPDDDGIRRFLRNSWAFDRVKVTKEDKRRAESYRQNAQRETLRRQARSFEDFLDGLSLEVKISSMSPDQLPRVSQLTQRTNQFNFTTRRRSETEIQRLLQSSDIKCLTVDVSDRFGDYGLVGLMILRLLPGAVDVETFLLSCRVLGRGVEHRMLAGLGQLAREQGRTRVDVHYFATKKNRPALDYLETVGPQFRHEIDGGYIYRFPAEYARAVKPTLASTSGKAAPPAIVEPAGRQIPLAGETDSLFFQRIYTELDSPERILDAMASAARRLSANDDRDLTAPTSETQARLIKIWENVLAIEAIGIHHNFFDLGGTSLQAVRVFSEIERAIGIRMALGTLIEAPTIEQLARLIDRLDGAAQESVSLVAIQPGGSKPPFFCVHAAGGNVLFYRDLAARLGPDQPLFGLQLLGLDERKPRHRTVEEMAAHYIKEIRGVQLEAPYFIGGTCFGGLVAFEMAQQLHSSGQEVALVALFDTGGPGYPRLRPISQVLGLARPLAWVRRIQHHWRTLAMLDPQERRTYLQDKGRKTKKLALRLFRRNSNRVKRKILEIVAQAPSESFKVHDAIRHAQENYVPRPYPGKITLFRGSERPLGVYPDPTMGWGEMAGQLEVHEAPGCHAAIIAEPRVRITAKILSKCLATAAAERRKLLLRSAASAFAGSALTAADDRS